MPAALLVFCALSWTQLPRWLVLLGDASYALYLVHPFPMRAVRVAFARLPRLGVPRLSRPSRWRPACCWPWRCTCWSSSPSCAGGGAPGDRRPVLVVGGGRRVRGAAGDAGWWTPRRFTVIAAGRSAGQARPVGRRIRAAVSTLVLDARTVTPVALAATGAFAVVDAAGPYQGGDYHLAAAAIAAGLHFIDLADARDYVAGFASLDAAARQAGVVALTGASSTPALSNAALDTLTAGWRGGGRRGGRDLPRATGRRAGCR